MKGGRRWAFLVSERTRVVERAPIAQPAERAERSGVAPPRVLTCSISSTDCGRIWVPRCHGGMGNIPPPQVGQRVTTVLTRRAARALQDGSYKATTLGHGFRAHWTFTLDAESRTRLLAGDFTLGSEMRRTLNALQTWNARHGKPPLRYEWVAENPGDANPHVHLNTDFLVPRRHFAEYAAFVEAAWGHGMVHQERLRNPKAAAAYLLKAVGYVTKGTQSGQGTVVGNRYGISACLRATAQEPVELEVGSAVHDLTKLPAGVAFRDLGHGVFATPYGVGTKPWAGVSVEAFARFLQAGGGWERGESTRQDQDREQGTEQRSA